MPILGSYSYIIHRRKHELCLPMLLAASAAS